MIEVLESTNNNVKDILIDTILHNITGSTYRHGAELIKIISDKSGVDYDTCFELLKDVARDINIQYANELLKFPMINGGNGFTFTLNYPYCLQIVKKNK